jgi:hypothetical protein
LQMNSHLALILRRNSRRSSSSIGIMADIAEGWNGGRSAGTRENGVSGAFSAAHQNLFIRRQDSSPLLVVQPGWSLLSTGPGA